MKTWHIAAISALLLMGLMSWPFVRGHLGYGTHVPTNAPIGGDFELTRQDGREMKLSDLGAEQYWVAFMEPKCIDCPAELRRVESLALPGQLVVVSADPELDPGALGRWVNQYATSAVSFGGGRNALAKTIGRYRLPAVVTEAGLDYPIRWYQMDSTGTLIQLHAAGFTR